MTHGRPIEGGSEQQYRTPGCCETPKGDSEALGIRLWMWVWNPKG